MASPTRAQPAPVVFPGPPTDPRENGDHLTRDEFERRYKAMPQVKKAELIEGVVHAPSPVRHQQHGMPHVALSTWLGAYWAATPGVSPGDHSTLRLDPANEPQPDPVLLIEPRCGGRAQIDAEGYIVGAPELVAEVAASTVSTDLHQKREVYRRNGVPEYLVWRVHDQAVDWFVLRQGQYTLLAAQPDGSLRSETFAGLWLDPAALVRLDLAGVLRVMQQGTASAEHAAFVAGLAVRRAAAP